MTSRVFRFSAISTLTILALTACTAAMTEKPKVQSENLGQAQYALYFSPPSSDIVDNDGDLAHVLLADGAGKYSLFGTNGMDLGMLAWSDKALYFSDFLFDYKLDNEGLKKTESPKTDSQNALFYTPENEQIGLYNLGFGENTHYSSQLSVTKEGISKVSEVEGNYFIAANCDGTVYGIGRATGKYSKTGDPETEPMLLNQLTQTADGKEMNIGASTDAKEGFVVPDAMCHDGLISYISDAGSGAYGGTPRPVLSVWDTGTGEYEALPMTSDVTKHPLLDSEGVMNPDLDSNSFREGNLEWFGAKNYILSTDIKTGKTEHKFELEGISDGSEMSQVAFTDDSIIQLVNPNDGSDLQIVTYNRVTGKEQNRVTLEGALDQVSVNSLIHGFAVRPES